MQLKYIIDNTPTKQFGGSFNIEGDKKIHLKLVVSKKLDDHFCKVLDNLHAKEGTEITLVDNNKFIDDSIFAENVENWNYKDKKLIRKKISDFSGLFFIWDLIDAVKEKETVYNITNQITDQHIVKTITNLNIVFELLKKLFKEDNNFFFLLKKILYNKNINIIKDDDVDGYDKDLLKIKNVVFIENNKLTEAPNDQQLKEYKKEIKFALYKTNILPEIIKIFGIIREDTHSGSYSTWYHIVNSIKDTPKYGFIMPIVSEKFDSNVIIQTINLLSKVSEENISPRLHEQYPFLFFYNNTEKRYKLVVVSQQYQYNLQEININSQLKPMIIQQILTKIDKLLELNLIYLDIKSNNIVVNTTPTIDVRIIDWDLNFTCYGKISSQSKINNMCILLERDDSLKKKFKLILLILFSLQNTKSELDFNDAIKDLINDMLKEKSINMEEYKKNFFKIGTSFIKSNILDEFFSLMTTNNYKVIFTQLEHYGQLYLNNPGNIDKNFYNKCVKLSIEKAKNEKSTTIHTEKKYMILSHFALLSKDSPFKTYIKLSCKFELARKGLT
mgnify:CR=1 FL=1